MSGNDEKPFREPLLALAYLQAFAARYRSGYYEKYIESLHLEGSERMLEYGSGPGVASAFLARTLTGGCLTCVDISKVWMRFARRTAGRYPNVEFLQGDLSDLEIGDESYDGAFVHFMLHDIPASQRSEKIGILVSKLKRGGRVYLREPTREKHGMPAEEIRAILGRHGLKEISSGTGNSPVGWPTFQCIYVK
ncbi:MAG TPA: class I SAM-dependent methyltransferase [Methanocella sp.]|nr:class I SAM-dependent methyltransferase [Methanocella sp.]